jgi:hypothetical protein
MLENNGISAELRSTEVYDMHMHAPTHDNIHTNT